MNLDDVKTKMQRVLDTFSHDLAAFRTGRATPALVENIMVSVYGGSARMRVLEVGSIVVTDGQTITITPWDESIVGDIRKGIMEANVGLNGIIDGNVIRIAVPALTSERRDELVKSLSARTEETKVSLRQVRHEKMGEIKRASETGEINEDARIRLEKQLQEEMDRFVAKADQLSEAKQVELKTI